MVRKKALSELLYFYRNLQVKKSSFLLFLTLQIMGVWLDKNVK